MHYNFWGKRKEAFRIISWMLAVILFITSIPGQAFVAKAEVRSDWERVELPFSPINNGAFGNDYFLMLNTDGDVYRSKDGVEWECAGKLSVEEFYYAGSLSVTFCGNYFYAYGAEGYLWCSKDGKEWQSTDIGNKIINCMTYAQGKYYALTGDAEVSCELLYGASDACLMQSEDGLNWKIINENIPQTEYAGMTSSNGVLAVVSRYSDHDTLIMDMQGNVLSSFEVEYMRYGDNCRDINIVNDVFVLQHRYGVYMSEDGKNWTLLKKCSPVDAIVIDEDYYVLEQNGDLLHFPNISQGNTSCNVLRTGENMKVYSLFAGKGILFAGGYNQLWRRVYCYEKETDPTVSDNVVSGNEAEELWETLTEDITIDGDYEIVEKKLDLNGHTLTVTGTLTCADAAIKTSGGRLCAQADVIVEDKTQLEGDMLLEGDLKINGGCLSFLHAQINVKGNVEVAETPYNYGLSMLHEDDILTVDGNFTYHSSYEMSKTYGKIVVSGDMDLTGNFTQGDHQILCLNGSQKQTIQMTEATKLGYVLAQNTSAEGIVANRRFSASGFESNGGKFNYGDGNTEGILGCTLTEDRVIYGDLYLMDGILDLNGHVLHVKGDLIQAAGTIYVNGGTLTVDRDYRLQYRTGSEAYTYDNSTGILRMTNEDDHVLVKGDCHIQTETSMKGYLTDGTLAVQGDFLQTGEGLFVATENHKTVFEQKSDGEETRHTVSMNPGNKFHTLQLDWADWYEIESELTDISDEIVYGEGVIVPEAPVLEIIEVSSRTISMKWNKSENENLVYQVYRVQMGTWNVKEILIAENLEENVFHDTNPEPYDNYYKVVAVNEMNLKSEASDVETALCGYGFDIRVTPADGASIGGIQTKFQIEIESLNYTDYNLALSYLSEDGETYKPLVGDTFFKEDKDGEWVTYEEVYVNLLPFKDTQEIKLKFEVSDRDGIVSTQICTYSLDFIEPEKPTGLAVRESYGDAYLTWTKSVSTDCSTYEVYRKEQGGSYELVGTASGAYYKDQTIEAETEYTYYIVAVDEAGNRAQASETVSIILEADTVLPVVNLSNLKQESIVNATQRIYVSATDNRKLSCIKVYLTDEAGGKILLKEESETSYSVSSTFDWDTAQYADGKYQITAIAEDTAGNISEEAAVTCTVDNTPPGEVEGFYATAKDTTISVTWNSVPEDVHYIVLKSYPKGRESSYNQYKFYGGEKEYDIRYLTPETDYVLCIYAVDKAGNEGEQIKLEISTIHDCTNPEITGCEPKDNYYINKWNPEIRVYMYADDNIALGEGVFSYSTDGENYEELARIPGDGYTYRSYYYDWDVSNIPDGEVYILFQLYDAYGNSDEKKVKYVIDRISPGVPQNFVGEAPEDTVYLSWEAPDDDVRTYYITRYHEKTGKYSYIQTEDCSYADEDVIKGDYYTYKIYATDMAGNSGEYSEYIEVKVGTNPPKTILDFQSTDQSYESITLGFTLDPQDTEIAYYDLRRNRKSIATITEEQTSYMDPGLSINTEYAYELAACDEHGNIIEITSEICIKTLEDTTPPEKVDKITLTERTGSRVSFCWEEVTDDYKMGYYQVYRDGEMICDNLSGHEYMDENLEPDVSYTYQVIAVDAQGNKSVSDNFTITTVLPVIEEISPVEGTVIGGYNLRTKITVLNDKLAGVRYVRLLYYNEDKNTWISICNEVISSQSNNGLLITQRMDVNIAEIKKHGDVRFKVVVTDVDGNCSEKETSFYVDRIGPAIPETITAKEKDAKVTLTWSRSKEDDCSKYRIYRKTLDEEENYEQIKVIEAGNEEIYTYVDKTVKQCYGYAYYIRTEDRFGNTCDSQPVEVYVETDITAPLAPTGAYVRRSTGSAITVSWYGATDNVSVYSYNLYRDNELIAEQIKQTYFKDTGADLEGGLQQYTIYNYTVKAFDVAGNESDFSPALEAAVIMPKITSITPSDRSTLGGEEVTIRVDCEYTTNCYKNNTVNLKWYDNLTDTWIAINDSPIPHTECYWNESYMEYTWTLPDLGGSVDKQLDVSVTLMDEDGNETEQIVTYTIDRTGPYAPKEVVAEENSGVAVVQWKTSTSSDAQGYYVYRKEQGEDEYTELAKVEGRLSGWYQDKAVETGKTYSYCVSAYDKFEQEGDKSDAVEVTIVTGDTTSPKISAMTPDAGKVTGKVTIQAEGSDNRAIKEISFYIRTNAEEEWKELATSEAIKNVAGYKWDTTFYADGNYYIKAVARDAAGNESEALFQRRYEVDNTGIEKIILSECTPLSTMIRLTWEDVTESDFAYFSVEQKMENAEKSGQQWEEIAKVTDRLGYDVKNVKPDCAYTFRVVGYDTLGNKGIYSEEKTITTLSDTTAPSIKSVNPISSYYGDKIALEVEVTDNAGISKAVFSYSTNGKEFNVLAEVEAAVIKTKQTFRYDWDTSALPEGNVTVRFEAYDMAGLHNRLMEGNEQVEVTYILDHTRPSVPTNFTATGSDGCVNLFWDLGKEEDLKEYRIYRSKTSNGEYKRVRSVQSNATYDGNVEPGETYYYKICVVDIAENESEMTAPIMVTVLPDREKPVVAGIGPVDTDMLGSNPTFEFIAYDNRLLTQYRAEYRAKDTDEAWTQICEQTIKEQRDFAGKATWNTDGLKEKTVYEIRVIVTDKAGNESDPVSAEYMLDLTPPEQPVLTAKPGSFRILLERQSEETEQTESYEIWRRAYGSKEYEFVTGMTSSQYEDTTVETGKIYYYKLRAYDAYGNYSESDPVYSHASSVDTIAPVAALPEISMAVAGIPFDYDGTLSTDNVRIVEYEWDFGDGTKASGAKPVHSYKRAGNYTVTLGVSDAAGNLHTSHTTVTVKDEQTHGQSTVKVMASDGSPIAGAEVYVNTDGTPEGTIRSKTNDLGEAIIVGEQGIYTVAAFADGYLPKETELIITTGIEGESEIILPSGEIVTGELTFERMELEQMKEAGVDLSNPQNYNTFSYSVTFSYEEKPIPVVIKGKARKTPFGFGGYNHGGKGMFIYTGDGENGDIDIVCKEEENEEGEVEIKPVALIYMTVAESVSWLQDMYSVNLTIDNHADSGFVLENATATLDISDGLALAATKSGQTKEIQLGDIDGQQSALASWVVRGTKKGSFPIGASFSATMQPFNVPITRYFASEKEIEVPAGAGLSILVQPEEIAVFGEAYYVKFTISNNSDRIFYNLKTRYKQENEERSDRPVYVVNPETCEVEEVDTGDEPVNFVYPDGNNGQLSAIVKSGDSIQVGIFAPGEKIVSYFMGCASPTDEEHYLEFVDSFVNVLKGENLGVSVTVAPMESHASIPVTVQTQTEEETYGDPVDVTTGAFLQEFNAFVGGDNNLFDLVYDSTKADKAADTGYGWSHSYDQRIEEMDGKIILHLGNGQEITFIGEAAKNHWTTGVMMCDSSFYIAKATRCDRAGVGNYVPAMDNAGEMLMIKSRDGDEYSYILTDSDGTKWYFNHDKKVEKRVTKEGIEYTYKRTENKLTVTDPVSKEFVTLIYNEEGKIETVSEAGGRSINLVYDEAGNIVSYMNEEGLITQFFYDKNHHLIKGVGPDKIVMFENTFDGEGRVLTQVEAGSTLRSSFSYSEESDDVSWTKIKKRDGSMIAYTYNKNRAILSKTDELGQTTSYKYNSSCELIQKTDPDGSITTYTYDEKGNLLKVQDPEGNYATYTYDVSGNTTGIRGADTGNGTFFYNEKGLMTRSVSLLGEERTYEYDAYGQALKETVTDVGDRSFLYKNGKKISEKDYLGNKTTYEYDRWGNLIQTTDALGNYSSSEYDAMGRPVSVTDSGNSTTSYEYDKLGRLVCEETEGRETIYTYDDAGRVTCKTDPLGRETKYVYDVEGNLIVTEYPDGTTEKNTYDAAGRLTETILPDQSVNIYTYDSNSRVISEKINGLETRYTYYKNGKKKTVTHPDGTSETYSYNSAGYPVSVTDQDGNKTTYVYDKAGNVTKITDALGNSVNYQYNSHGQLIQKTDANQNKETYAYDANGNCIRMTNAEGTVYRMSYDKLGRMVKTAVKIGEKTLTETYAYDASGRLTAMTDALGNTVSAKYDSFGNVIRVTDAEGNVVTKSSYDAIDRLIKVADALGRTTQYVYDNADNVTETVSSTGAATTYAYDAAGHLTMSTDAEGGIVKTSYTESGLLSEVTDAGGGTTKYSYDSLQRVIVVTSAVGTKESYSYNGQGLLAQTQNARGQKTTYTYDALGRISSQTDALGTIRYTYDPNGNVLTVSEEQGLETETITRTYDSMNRVTSVTDYNGNTVKYGYDQLGNRISITYPGGEIVRYTYDDCGRMLTVADADGKVTRYTYDKNGRLIKQSRPDGSVETRTYDAAGQLLEQKDVASGGSVIHQITYTYDTLGNVIERTGSTGSDASVYTDASMTYDKDNRLVTYNGEKVIYDKDGNMTRGPIDGQMADLTYDCRNRLIRVTAGEMTTEYRYDAENVRTAEVTKNTKSGEVYQKTYVTDREAEFSQLLTESTQKKNILGIYETTGGKTYTYGIGLLSEKSRTTTEKLYYHFDNLGSTTEVTDYSGSVIYRFAYDAYGRLTGVFYGNTNLLTAGEAGSVSEALSEIGIRFLYNGEFGVQTDANTLYYMRARYYNPQIMRFINRDIVEGNPEKSQSLNRYAYAQGNPVNQIDPFGLSPQNPYSKAGHTFLDFLGLFIDGADVINAAWYLAEGDYVNAALSGMSIIPIVGIGFFGLKASIKAGKTLTKSSKLIKALIKTTTAAWEGTAKVGKKIGGVLKNLLKKVGSNGAAEGATKIARTADEAADAAKLTAKTTAEAAEDAAKKIESGTGAKTPTWKGSGPAPGVLGINANSTSNMAIKNYAPKEGMEFVFDASTNTFVVGKNKYNKDWGSPHQKLAKSIGANQGASTTLGGVFSRGPDGKIYTNENSGHFGKNWTSALRTQFIETMRGYGVEVIHDVWK